MKSSLHLPTLPIAIAAAILATITVGCNHRSPLSDAAGSVVPSPPSARAPIALFGISLNPPGVFGSAPGTGTAILTRQVENGSVVVTLSSADASIAAVPPAVVIPEGTDRAVFPITTQTVSTDRQVSIAGSAIGTSASVPLQVWAVLPTFFSWFSDPGDVIGKGGFGRLTPANATFTATGGEGGVTINASGQGIEFWRLEFAAPRNTKLQIGRYEDAMRSTFRDAVHPGLDIAGRAIGCNTLGGRFEVREFILTVTQTGSFSTTTLSRFDATFEQHCDNAVPALRGEVRYNAGAR